MQEDKICSFFGHRDVEDTQDLANKINEIVTDLIENKNVTIFWFDGYCDFSDYCLREVTKQKDKYPYLQRKFCMSTHINDKPPKWVNLCDYDGVEHLDFFDYWYTRIYYRNCEMINQSDYVVFNITNKNSNSGAYKAYKYAKSKKARIIEI
ncbi:MAG: hypothetical protein R3Y23_06340 [Bacillota bacterium]